MIDAERTAEEQAAAQAAAEQYDASNVDVLRDAEHIRQRPGMYIGDTGPKGCTIWSTNWSPTASTRPWPASASTSTSASTRTAA